jgi:hypothetical protein
LASALFVVANHQPVFDTNDDTAMMLIACGATTGQPSSALVFVHPGLGLGLATLYGLAADVPWHGLMLYAGYVLALAVAARLAWRPRVSVTAGVPASSLAVLSVLAAAFAVPLVRPQFTTVAILLGSLASLWVLWARSRSARLAAFGLLAFASMVRGAGGLLGVGLIAPLVLLPLRLQGWRDAFASVRRPALLWGLCLMTAGAVSWSHAALYDHDPAWAEARDYQRARSRLLDAPVLIGEVDDEMLSVAAKVGWSANDLRVLKSWFTHDERVFSIERMQMFRAYAGGLERSPAEAWRGLVAKLDSVPTTSAIVACLALALLLAMGARREAAAVVTMAALVLAVALVILLRSKLPTRVLWPAVDLVAVVAVLLVARACHDRPLSPGRARRFVALGLIAAVGLPAAHRWLAAASERHALALQRSAAATEALLDRATEHGWAYVPVGLALRQRYVDPLADNAPLSALPVVRGGWLGHSPHQRAIFARHGIDDLLTDLVERDDLILVAFDFDARRVARFIEEHRGIKVRLERLPSVVPLRKLDGGFLYRLHRDAGDPGLAADG